MIALAGVSCASASSDLNDTAVEFDHDIAPVNDDFEDVIVNNVSVNDDADVSNVIANDVALNNQYMNFINIDPLTQQSNHQYIELTRLNSTILHFGHNDIHLGHLGILLPPQEHLFSFKLGNLASFYKLFQIFFRYSFICYPFSCL